MENREQHEAHELQKEIDSLQSKKQAVDNRIAAKLARNSLKKVAFEREVSLYRERCAKAGAHLPAWNRFLIALQNAVEAKEPIPNYFFKHRDIYRLQPLEAFVNDTCEGPEKPPVEPEYER